MELPVRTAFVDFDHDATINAEALVNFRYVSKGGFALVFLADYQRRDGVVQPVAVKVLKPENHFKAPNYQKFLQEVAFQTALAHGSIVRTLGFCSVQASKLLGAAPADLLVPGCGGNGRKAKSPLEWFAERRLTKCWALVMEMMTDGNMFDQVHASATAAAAAAPALTKASSKTALLKPIAPPPPPPRPPVGGGGGGVGSYSDAQALLWMIDVAEAMTFLHSQQPLLIHRDLKLENILLRREADGRIHAKLADFGLMVAVDASGKKLPPPKVLRAPGQSLQDVLASAPAPPPPRGAQSNSQLPLDALKAPLRGQSQKGQSQSQKRMQPHQAKQSQPAQQQKQQQPDTLRPGLAAGPQRSSFSWTGQGRWRSSAFKGESGNIANATGSGTPAAGAAPPSSPSSQAQVQLQPDPASSGSSSSFRRGRSAAAEGKAVEASSNLQEAQAASGAGAGASGGGRGAGGGVGTSREPGRAAAAAALPRGLLDLQRMPSLSRLSATSHTQVKMGQLNEVTRMGMGHKDYLPDMYQMSFKLTGQCGSVCYMAPEVARQLAYNQKADVFSFGCLLYEVLTRRLLSEGIADGDADAAMEYVSRVAWSGWRPELPTWMAKDLRLLISLCWHREPRLRPSFPTIASRLREALSRAAEPSVPAALRPPGQSEQAHVQLLTQQALLQQQASARRNQAGPNHSPPQQQQQQQQYQQQQQQQAFFPAVAWTSGPQGQTAGSSPFGSGPVPVGNGGGGGGGLGTTQQQLQQQLQQLQLAQQQQQQQRMVQKQKQQQQQLLLHLQQLNACTRVSSANQRTMTYTGLGPCNQALLPSPVRGYDTSNGSHSNTTAAGKTQMGGRASSPMLWGPQARATSAASLDVAFPMAGVANLPASDIAGTLSPCDAASLPSPVVGRPSNGADVSRLTGVTRSEPSAAAGSVSASAVSVMSPRSSQAELKRLPPEAGCMSLCTVM